MTASVRLRVTGVAVVVTALALTIGGWALVQAMERTELARIARATDERVEEVAQQLAAGVPIQEVLEEGDEPFFGFVQVIDNGSDRVVAASPGIEARPFVTRSYALGGVATAGGGVSDRITASLPGAFEDAVELQLSTQQVDAGGRTLTVAAASPLADVARSLDALRRSLWLALPAVVALVGGIAWSVTGRALRPVEAMRAQAESITHSTLHRRVPVPPVDDEVGRLARTMNAMLDRLESSADRQRRFVSDASHELRSPVAALRTELEVALRSADEAGLRTAVEGALAEEARLEELLADLLLLAAVDESAPVAAGPVDVGDLAREAAAQPREVPVSVTGDGVVVGSATQLRRVVANLLDNAARHAGSAVAVSIDGGRITVDDDGPGIPEADRERVFERFTRLDESRARDHGGAGLGLSLVRAVAAAHGGRAWAEGSPLGGARLVVDLPA